jgi:putative salt-induced outer membrane protein YdiY
MLVPSSRTFTYALTLALSLVAASPAVADEILFLNGDRLTGKIVGGEGGKLTIKTDSAGDVTVDLSKVKTFSTDEPITLKTGDTTLSSKVTGGPDGAVQVIPVAGGPAQVIALKDVAQINPPPIKWTGSLTANALVTSGNSETENFGGSLNAVRRSEQDRITLGAGYYYGREKDQDSGDKNTTVNNWFVLGKYDYFLTKKVYTYASVRAEGDKIADLDLRLTTSLGVGYQWYETPTFNLFTEAGLAWVYEDFRNQDSDDHFAARLAYHVDWKPHKAVSLFHNLEWLPSLDGPFDDYNLNTDVGLRATIIQGFFAEAKVELRYDSTPARGKEKDDVRYLFGIGWSF